MHSYFYHTAEASSVVPSTYNRNLWFQAFPTYQWYPVLFKMEWVQWEFLSKMAEKKILEHFFLKWQITDGIQCHDTCWKNWNAFLKNRLSVGKDQINVFEEERKERKQKGWMWQRCSEDICLAYMLPQRSPALVFGSSTWSSLVVSHPSTIQAQCCLTSVFEWELFYTIS